MKEKRTYIYWSRPWNAMHFISIRVPLFQRKHKSLRFVQPKTQRSSIRQAMQPHVVSRTSHLLSLCDMSASSRATEKIKKEVESIVCFYDRMLMLIMGRSTWIFEYLGLSSFHFNRARAPKLTKTQLIEAIKKSGAHHYFAFWRTFLSHSHTDSATLPTMWRVEYARRPGDSCSTLSARFVNQINGMPFDGTHAYANKQTFYFVYLNVAANSSFLYIRFGTCITYSVFI